MATYRLGIDIGGTFTDGALVEESSGELTTIKVLTTSSNPADGFMEALERARAKVGFAPPALSMLAHATTIATNALIEGSTARLALITTAGFRDVLEIGYQTRPRLYDIFQAKPRPLVPRRRCYGVTERLDHLGNVLEPLDEAALRKVVAELAVQEVEAVVVCFLHSYVNPVHELRAAEILRAELPQTFLSISCEVCPEFREFARASTAAVNAAVMPVVSRYVDDIETRLGVEEITAPFYIMQSNGGVMSGQAARTKPVYMVESGPAAGVIAAGALAQAMGHANVISFDMGGTTAKVGLIRDGKPKLSTEYEVGGQSHKPIGEGKGSGYPVRTAVIDLVEVGAGGGSLAWIDAGGGLRVGPKSAGASPGPACYPRGGEQPALTDANLLLGRLNPDFFLGGELSLDTTAAANALQRHIAEPLGLDPMHAASGVVDIANAGMIAAMRLISVERGYDPRDFVLVAFGGAGPLHAADLAGELGIPSVVVPPSPGVTSAVGLLMTDIVHEFVATRRYRLADTPIEELNAILTDFEERGLALLSSERDSWEDLSLIRTCELRYQGQSHELQVVLPGGKLDREVLERTRTLFEETHQRAYGYVAADDAIELVNVRLSAIGRLAAMPRNTVPAGDGDPARALVGNRAMWLRTGSDPQCPVYDRYALRAGDVVAGPALIEEIDSTTVVLDQMTARVDEHGNLLLARD